MQMPGVSNREPVPLQYCRGTRCHWPAGPMVQGATGQWESLPAVLQRRLIRPAVVCNTILALVKSRRELLLSKHVGRMISHMAHHKSNKDVYKYLVWHLSKVQTQHVFQLQLVAIYYQKSLRLKKNTINWQCPMLIEKKHDDTNFRHWFIVKSTNTACLPASV